MTEIGPGSSVGACALFARSGREAWALDRSPFERDEHILAVRITIPIIRGETQLHEAEDLARRAWRRLAPELEGYAPMRLGSTKAGTKSGRAG